MDALLFRSVLGTPLLLNRDGTVSTSVDTADGEGLPLADPEVWRRWLVLTDELSRGLADPTDLDRVWVELEGMVNDGTS